MESIDLTLSHLPNLARSTRVKERASNERRNDAVDAAIEVLAQRGARGLTHREIDRSLGWPLGSTSNYFRRRIDIFKAIAARIMQLDLADLAIMDADLDIPGRMSVEVLVAHMVRLVCHSMSPAQRSRSRARAEVLFESTRNIEVRKATEEQFAIADALFQRVFVQLGADDPAAAAQFFSAMMPSAYIGLSVTTHAPGPRQLDALVRGWVAISLDRSLASQIATPDEGKGRTGRSRKAEFS